MSGAALLLLAAAGPACAPLRPPIESSGPALSRDGVKLAVGRQACTQNVDPDFHGDDLVEERLEVEVDNATPAALTVRPGAFRLVTPDGYALSTMTWGAATPLTLAGGERRAFSLRFMTRGSLECTRPMKLDPDGALRISERPVELGAITFLPSRAL